MNQLVWRGETVNGKYLGEVAILTDLSPVIHCEVFVDGHWRLWSYIGEKEQVIQQGQAPSLGEAQHVCEQTALAIQGLQSSSPPMPNMPPMQQPMPMANMYMHYPPMPIQGAYEEVATSISAQELRYKFRRWAISLTMIGGVFLSIWYSMMLKPLSTISLLFVIASIIWGAQSLIKSFKRSSVVASTEGTSTNIFPRPQIPQMPQIAQYPSNSFMPNAMHVMQSGQTVAAPIQAPVQAMAQLPLQATQANFYNPHLQH